MTNISSQKLGITFKQQQSMRAIKLTVLTISASAILSACTSSRPVIYPNQHAEEVGDAQVRKDINECLQLAKRSGAKSNAADEIAKNTAGSATEGAATGAATGAVTGNPGTSAAIGAISRGMSRFFSGLRGSNQPSPAFRQIVERCLIDKGYEPIGWE